MSTQTAERPTVVTDKVDEVYVQVIQEKRGWWSRAWGKIKGFFRAIGRGIKRAAKAVWRAICWTGRKAWQGLCFVGRKIRDAAKWTGRKIWAGMCWIGRIRLTQKKTQAQQAKELSALHEHVEEKANKLAHEAVFGASPTEEELNDPTVIAMASKIHREMVEEAAKQDPTPENLANLQALKDAEAQLAAAHEAQANAGAPKAQTSPKAKGTPRQGARRPKRPPVGVG